MELRRLLLCPLALALAPLAGAAPPPEGRCPTMAGSPGAAPSEDAAPTRLREGMVLDYDAVLLLSDLLPPEVWRNRDIFFFEGMKLVIGPCHRRYPVADFFEEATAHFAGQASVDDDGNLEGYVAGTPFPQDTIPPDDPKAGTLWAWNLEHRYRGAGPSGDFRIVDLGRDLGSDQTYRGSFFLLATRHRADLPASDYRLPDGPDTLWISGGRFDEPFDARHLAWRQLRPPETEESYTKSDETFVYVPTMRKVRRGATPWVDGVYTPRYRVGGDDGGGGLGLVSGSGEYGAFQGSGVIAPTAGRSAAVSEHIPRGFVDLSLRPNAYVWRVAGEREVLAPLNSGRPGYPLDPGRNFGPSGLSPASDRWDVRWAVLLEGLARQPGGPFEKIVLYVDWQTLQPLYVITKRRKGYLVDVGIPVHRFSGDVFDYPVWPDGSRARVFDPVGAFFYHPNDQSGWRRESWGVTSVPPEERDLRRYLTTDTLMRGR